jgi:hypothetical protein
LFRYARYDDQLAKTKAFNRDKENDFVAEVTEIAPGKNNNHFKVTFG